MAKQYTSTIDKIHTLIHKMGKTAEQIEFADFDLNMRDEDDAVPTLYAANQRYKRLNQKLRKQMAKYLEETNE